MSSARLLPALGSAVALWAGLGVLLSSPAVGAAGFPVRAVLVAPDGGSSPLSDQEISLEVWKSVPGPMGDRALETAFTARTDALGRVSFDGVPVVSGGQYVASTVFQGISYERIAARGGAGTELRTYQRTDSVDRLSGSLRVHLSTRDGFVIVDTTLSIDNSGREVVDLTTGDGLRMPIALPALYGEAIQRGIINRQTGPGHMSTRATPAIGRFEFLHGGVYWQGAAVPGEVVALQVRYGLPIVDERQDLALSSPIDISDVIVSSDWTDRVSPRVVPDRPFRAVGRDPGEQVQRFMLLEKPPKAGESMVIHMDRLPRPLAVFTAAAWAGIFALLMAFVLVTLTVRRRVDAA